MPAIDPRVDYSELDITWYAEDATGAIGCFASTGVAPVYLLGTQELAVRIKDIRQLVDYFESLPRIGEAIVNSGAFRYLGARRTTPVECMETSGFLEWARRGLYAFFADDVTVTESHPYVRAASPTVPLNTEQLPTRIRNILRGFVLPRLEFRVWDRPIDLRTLL